MATKEPPERRRKGPEPISIEPPPAPRPAPLGVAFTDVTFLHWRYDPALVRPLLPPGLVPDTFDGVTYVGLVPFRMCAYGEFLETNVRVYSVDPQGRRGTVFLTMEADRLTWVLAARATGLPYAWSRMSLVRDTHLLCYDSVRRWPGRPGTGTQIRVRAGHPVEGGPLEHFLTARWRLHHAVRGVPLAIPLFHNRWPLHTAELLHLDDQLITATGLPAPTEPPVSVLHAPSVRGRFGLPIPAW
ncbi:YqjF family protein [Pseudonocardia nigra]|uniref:YqjF family protein n=1 Tax=Pseudonocardia nigra TaxID=1921578 RepID=UPI001FE49984|nr:DUF2071 domain-containing protein [Pseudonocardia nigra]